MRNIYPLVAILILLFTFAISPAFAEGEVYTCPMHPHIISETEGTCPICGMDLVALENDDGGSDDEGEGRVTVRINPQTIQNIGVRTQKTVMADFGSEIRSYGVVSENSRLQQDISSRVSGWIEVLKVTSVGDSVKNGDLLYTMYSPELVSAQQDYIAALATGAKGRINSAAKRMESLGVQKMVLADLKKNRKKLQNIPFYAETNGIISRLNIKKGTFVKSGMQIAEIQDYSSVWININVAEKDLQFITKDSKATVIFPNLGGFERIGSVDYIYPTIDASSRTGKVRVVLDNLEGKLKPGAYADVEFETNIEKRLSIPSEAILKSSDGDFVVIDKGKGHFQPVKIKTGITNKGITEVISGINAGEMIVVSSQFMIDSESSLREAFRKMKKPNNSEHGGH